MVQSAVVEAIDVVKHFPASSEFLGRKSSRKYVHAVDGVSVSINENEILGLLGESGSGKTTLAQIILMLTRPTSGKIIFEGKSIENSKENELRKIRRYMQVVFQDPNSSLDPRMKVFDIIAEPLTAHGHIPKEEISSKVFTALERVGLNKGSAERYPHEFSGGQKQRIAIARAIVGGPRFVVLDEPTSSLDVSVQASILNLLVSLQKQDGLSYLFISHNIDVIRYISDRIAVMYLGKIVEIADSASLTSSPLHPYTQMLLSSAPSNENPEKKIEAKGEVPSAIDPPSGCRFHPRCPFAKKVCAEREPPLTMHEGRGVACFIQEHDAEYESDTALLHERL